jgi:hypothetical protein
MGGFIMPTKPRGEMVFKTRDGWELWRGKGKNPKAGIFTLCAPETEQFYQMMVSPHRVRATFKKKPT